MLKNRLDYTFWDTQYFFVATLHFTIKGKNNIKKYRCFFVHFIFTKKKHVPLGFFPSTIRKLSVDRNMIVKCIFQTDFFLGYEYGIRYVLS
jgi:hypothetical protein